MAEVLQVLESLPTKTDPGHSGPAHRGQENGPLQRDLYLYGFMEKNGNTSS